MDRDHIIRIILEGKNNFGNVVRDMARDVDVQLKTMRNQWKQTAESTTQYAKAQRDANVVLQKTEGLMGALRNRANALSLSLRQLRAEQDATAKSQARAAKESKDNEFALFGGGTARRGQGGRFERAPQQVSGARELLQGLIQGRRAAAEVRKQLRDQLALEGDAYETRRAQFRQFEEEKARERRRRLEEEKEITAKAVADIEAEKLQIQLNAARELEGVKDKARRAEVAIEVRAAKDAVDARVRERKREGRERLAAIKSEIAEEIRLKRTEISPINEADVTRRVLNESTAAIDQNASAFRRLGHTAGRTLGDLGRGFSDGRQGLRALTVEGQRADGIFARLGNTIGRATRSLGTLVNLRWFILISALQLFGTLVATIGANLVSLASSATLAGAALGGAFAAALGQGIVTLGLFKAAAASVSSVLDAVKIAEQERLRAGDDATQKAEDQRTAVQRLADANWSLKLALEGVTDAQDAVADAEDDRRDALRDQRRAVIDLAEARRDAARAIVDANLEERDAALSLEEAELAVLDAKIRLREEQDKQTADKTDLEDARLAVQEANERLRIAKQEGDAVEIGAALSQLAVAEQNLAAIQTQIDESETNLEQAQLAVKRAELNQQQAAIRNKRAAQDAAEARKKGVEGSDEVQQAREQLRNSNEAVADATDRVAKALRGVRDAVHAVAIARREQRDAELGVTEAVTKQTAAQEDLQNRLADMSPAERKLFNSLRRIRKIYEDNFGPISDIIVAAYARAVDRAAILLEDSRILNAAKRLATAIANAIDTISKFTLTPEFRRALVEFLDQAAKNVPLLTRAFLALLRVFLRLGTVGAPLFRNLLERFVGMVERLEKATRDPSRLERFFAGARRHLDAWIELGKAVGGVVGALIPQAAGAAVGTEPGVPGSRTVVDRGRRSADPQPAGSEGILGFVTKNLNRAQKFFEENPDSATNFFNDMAEALENLAPILGRTIALLLEAFTSEEAAAFSRVILEVVIPGLAGLIKVLGTLSRILLFILDIPIVGDIAKFALSFLVFEKAINKIFPVSQKVTDGLKTLAGAIGGTLMKSIKNASLRPFALLFDGIRLRAMYARDAIGLLMVRLRAMAVLLAGRISAAVRLFALLVRTNIRLIIGATGIGLLLVAIGLIYEHWDKIGPVVKKVFDKVRGYINTFIDWVKRNWKLLVAIFLAPFFLTGVIILTIFRFRDKILGVFRSMVTAIKNLFVGMVNWIKDKILGIGQDIVNKARDVVNKIKGVFGGSDLSNEVEQDANTRANKILETSAFDTVRPRIKKLRAQGKKGLEILNQLVEEGFISEERVSNIAKRQNLAVGGTVDGPLGQAVPIIAHAGEWVINKMQQSKLLSRLRMTADEAKAFLFGAPGGPPGSGGPPAQGRVKDSFRGSFFNLTTQVDDDGNEVHFIEMDDGAWGQISKRAAARVKASKGNWVPQSVLRSTHGYTKRGIPVQIGRGLARGGVVIPSYALGGVVQAPGGDITSGAAVQTRPGQTVSKQVSQEFNVKAEGTMDWNYIMRLGAMRAQEV